MGSGPGNLSQKILEKYPNLDYHLVDKKHAKKRFEKRGVKNYNIGDNKVGHVQSRSVLGSIYDHTKGQRKIKGKSPEARI